MANETVSLQQRQARSRALAPWLSPIVMFPPIIISTVLTFGYFTNPARATAGTMLNTPEAFTDTRVQGAWLLTLLILLITFIVSRERLWSGHFKLAIFMGATLVACLYGFAHDGTTLAMGNQRVITIVEIVFLVLNSIGPVAQLLDGRTAGLPRTA